MSAVTIYSKLCYWQTTGVCRTTRVNKPNKCQHVSVKCKDTIALNQTQDEEFVDQVFRLGHKSFHSGQARAETETICTMDKTNKGNHFPRRVELHFHESQTFPQPNPLRISFRSETSHFGDGNFQIGVKTKFLSYN